MALMAALGWAVDQPSFAPRADHLSYIIASAIVPNRPGHAQSRQTRFSQE
jgi:hypothetical protein